MRNLQTIFLVGTALWLAFSPTSFGQDYSAPAPQVVDRSSASAAPQSGPDTVQQEVIRLTKHIEVGEEEHKISNKEALKFKYAEEKLITLENNLRDHPEKKSNDARGTWVKNRLVKLDSEVQALRAAPGYTQ